MYIVALKDEETEAMSTTGLRPPQGFGRKKNNTPNFQFISKIRAEEGYMLVKPSHESGGKKSLITYVLINF